MKINKLKANAISNYLSQIYIVLIGLITAPIYLDILGASLYGIIGLFILIQSWLNIFDIGMSPTFSRQVAIANGLKTDNSYIYLKKLLKSFEVIFFVISFFIIVIIIANVNWFVDWVNVDSVDLDTIRNCIILMSFAVVFKLFSSLYKSGLVGFESQVVLNIINILYTSLRMIGGIFILRYIENDIVLYFKYQVLITLFEIVTLIYIFYSKMPVTINYKKIFDFKFDVVREVLPFTFGIAYTAGLWILLTQTDKLILSKILSLGDFGYYSLVALVSGGILIFSGAISQAILPRLTLLFAQNKINEFKILYQRSSEIVTLISISLSLTIGIYSEELLYAWTGNKEFSTWGENILFWFSLGNGVLGVSAFQYYLQNAFGKIKLHIIGSTVSVILQVPFLYISAINYGVEGVAISWFVFRLIWFVCWTPIVHKVFLPNFHLKWMMYSIIPTISIVGVLSYLLFNFLPFNFSIDRFLVFMLIIISGMLLLLLSGSIYAFFVGKNFLIFKRIK